MNTKKIAIIIDEDSRLIGGFRGFALELEQLEGLLPIKVLKLSVEDLEAFADGIDACIIASDSEFNNQQIEKLNEVPVLAEVWAEKFSVSSKSLRKGRLTLCSCPSCCWGQKDNILSNPKDVLKSILKALKKH